MITDPVASCETLPGTAESDGANSHRAAKTPATPTSAPTKRSRVRRPANGGRTEWSREPSIKPTAWPISAPPTSTPTASTIRDTEPDTPMKLTMLGMKRTAR